MVLRSDGCFCVVKAGILDVHGAGTEARCTFPTDPGPMVGSLCKGALPISSRIGESKPRAKAPTPAAGVAPPALTPALAIAWQHVLPVALVLLPPPLQMVPVECCRRGGNMARSDATAAAAATAALRREGKDNTRWLQVCKVPRHEDGAVGVLPPLLAESIG